jgi:GT2 family glycosyltransferase
VPPDRTYGYLLGVSRADFMRVNGFDMRYVGWGEEDVDLAVRLHRSGFRCGHAGSDARLVHLWHEPAVSPRRQNWFLLQESEASDRVEAGVGVRELVLALGLTQLSANRVTASSSSAEPAKS